MVAPAPGEVEQSANGLGDTVGVGATAGLEVAADVAVGVGETGA
jgi:hypothetical protein